MACSQKDVPFWLQAIFSKRRWRERMSALQAGVTAPDFELPACTGKQRHKFKLSEFQGKKNIVLAFYPLDWSPT
jgi:alkyl hydroperoxide reductase subunit AhpC